jgi:hypothetical protein
METEFSVQTEIANSTGFRTSEASEKLGKSELATSNGEESQRKSSDDRKLFSSKWKQHDKPRLQRQR